MPIPIKKIPINLQKDTPSKVTPEELKEELNAIGLKCEETKVEKLEQYIDEILSEVPDGEIQGYGMFQYNLPNTEEIVNKGYTSMSMCQLMGDMGNIKNNWKPVDSMDYKKELGVIGLPEHFDCLKKNYRGFTGVDSEESYTKIDTTIEAVKDQFKKIAMNISSTLVADLDKDQMEAILVKIIRSINPGSEDYDSGLQNRGIFIVKGYSEGYCDAIGIINLEYQLVIKKHKDKKKQDKSYKLYVKVRTALYSDISELNSQVLFIQSRFKNTMFLGNNIPISTEVMIYDEKPPKNKDTFIHSLPLEQTENNVISVMVVYAPDLQNIGCIDNTDSDGQGQYSKSTTSGFTFSFGQKIAAGLKYEVGALISKAEVSMNMEISFTEQWNQSQTETITFTVPQKTKAFLYQGYLCCAVLEYNLKTFEYSYKETGRFLSNIIKTSPKPLGRKPVKIIKDTFAIENKLADVPLWEQL